MQNVLIVEDDPPIAMLERRVLEEAGFCVEEARRGDRALERLEGNHISLVVLDFRLPDMTGADIVAALGERIQRLPVVLVTGYAQPEVIDRMLKAGISGYLIKDTDLEFLNRLPGVVETLLNPEAR